MANVFGTSGRSNEQQASNAQLDPAIREAYLNNLNSAKGVAAGLGVQQFAPRTGDYAAGSDVLRQTALRGAGMANLNSAANMTGMNAMTSAADNVSNYLNPFTGYVAANTLDDLGRANEMALNRVRGDAISRNAFGGSRQALAEAETNRNFFTTAGNTLGNLYNNAYGQALSAASGDLNRNLAAAQQLGNLGVTQQGQGFQNAQALQNLGLSDQQFNQQSLDAERNLPLERQAIVNQALGLTPGGGAGEIKTSSGTGNSRSGLFK